MHTSIRKVFTWLTSTNKERFVLIFSAQEAANILHQGHTLAYPTEAVWGLGCDPMNEIAFHNILKLKQRPIEKGVILLASSIEQIAPLLENVSKEIQAQIVSSWSKDVKTDRATTWLLPVTSYIPTWIRGNHSSVAVRVTQHRLCQEICDAFGNFVVSTSANPAGVTPAKSLYDAQQYFHDDTYYLDGSLGENSEPSQIIDAVTGKFIRR